MEFLNKHKKAFIITAALLCLVFVFSSLSYRYQPTFIENMLGYVFTPTQRAFSRFGTWFSERVGFVVHLNELNTENLALRKEIDRLATENQRLRLAEMENKKLSALLELDQKYADYPKIGAEIIGKDPGSWYDTFTIDKGTTDGVYKNMVVLAGNGLAGKVISSGDTYSKIISLVDDESSVSVRCVRTEDIGYVRGEVELMSLGLCRMDFIDIDAEIIEGDEIVTSHLSDIYPPGITVGYVKEIRKDSTGLTKYAIIEPVVNFKRLETVLIINQTFNSTDEVE